MQNIYITVICMTFDRIRWQLVRALRVKLAKRFLLNLVPLLSSTIHVYPTAAAIINHLYIYSSIELNREKIAPEELRPLNFIAILSFSGYWLILTSNWSLVESFKWFSLTNLPVMGAAVDLGSVRAFLLAVLSFYSDSYIRSNYIEWSLGRPQPPWQKS